MKNHKILISRHHHLHHLQVPHLKNLKRPLKNLRKVLILQNLKNNIKKMYHLILKRNKIKWKNNFRNSNLCPKMKNNQNIQFLYNYHLQMMMEILKNKNKKYILFKINT